MFRQRYKYWTRQQLFDLMKFQAIEFNIDIDSLKSACFSLKWDPIKQFNGCNFVQDKFHPFLPCFIHDFKRSIDEKAYISDKEFRNNLLKMNFHTVTATTYYFGVRVGWFLSFKWIK